MKVYLNYSVNTEELSPSISQPKVARTTSEYSDISASVKRSDTLLSKALSTKADISLPFFLVAAIFTTGDSSSTDIKGDISPLYATNDKEEADAVVSSLLKKTSGYLTVGDTEIWIPWTDDKFWLDEIFVIPS